MKALTEENPPRVFCKLYLGGFHITKAAISENGMETILLLLTGKTAEKKSDGMVI